MILSSENVAIARNVAGETALEAYIRARAGSPVTNKVDDVVNALASSPAAVFALFYDENGSPVSNAAVEDFICRLVSCGSVVAGRISQSLGELASGNLFSGGKQMQAQSIGKRFMEACARVFITLF